MMWPLLTVSVVGFAVIVERGVYVARQRMAFEPFVDRVCTAVRAGDHEAARAATERRRRHPLSQMTRHFLAYAERPVEQRAEILRREGGLLLEAAERRLPLLRLVVQIAPILGLLGTVHGLLLAFWALESITGPIRPSDVAGGIGSALTTTVFGLSIAIPASGFLMLFEESVDGLSRRMSFLVSHLEEAMSDGRSEDTAEAGSAMESVAVESRLPEAGIDGASPQVT